MKSIFNILAFGFILLPLNAAYADRRVALVIGNGSYKNAPTLPNPRNDATDVAAALKRTGFDTIVGLDLDRDGMEKSTINFARAAREADVAIFYYSGHAMQFNGINYLMPVDAKLADEEDLRRMARVDEIIADVQKAKNLRIVVLDSCRDNPLAEQLKRSIGRTRDIRIQDGLARLDAPQGMIVAYSTQAGRTAADGTGRNSPYTAAFLKHIEESDEIGTVFRRVSADVYNSTKRDQLPELSLSFIGEFYLKDRPPGAMSLPIPQPTVQPQPSSEDVFWQSIKDTKVSAVFDEFLSKFPNSVHASEARNLKLALASPVENPSADVDKAGKAAPDGRTAQEKLSYLRELFDRASRSRGYVSSSNAGVYQIGDCKQGLVAGFFKSFDATLKLATSRLVWSEGDKFFFVALSTENAIPGAITPGRSVNLPKYGKFTSFNVQYKDVHEETGFVAGRMAGRKDGSAHSWNVAFARCPGTLESQRDAALTLVSEAEAKTSTTETNK